MSKKQPKNLEELSEQLAQENAELTEALQRERADVTNIRRRHEEQMASVKSLVGADIAEKLLPLIDNFERALKHVPKDLEKHDYIKGVQGLVKQFESTLTDIGVERIATTGQPFDPNLHDAVSHEEGDGDEVVSEEVQAGYKMGDTVLRPAMVRVKS